MRSLCKMETAEEQQRHIYERKTFDKEIERRSRILRIKKTVTHWTYPAVEFQSHEKYSRFSEMMLPLSGQDRMRNQHQISQSERL